MSRWGIGRCENARAFIVLVQFWLVLPVFRPLVAMGGQQSTRKITVNNDNTIQLSPEAIDRLSSQLQQKPAQPHYDPPPSYESSQQWSNQRASEEAYWSRRIDNLKKTHAMISASMQQEYEKTLLQANKLFKQTQDDKFVGKLPPCQEERAKRQRNAIGHGLDIVQLLCCKIWTGILQNMVMWRQCEVLQCYKAHPDQSLLCSALVNGFNDCVRSHVTQHLHKNL